MGRRVVGVMTTTVSETKGPSFPLPSLLFFLFLGRDTDVDAVRTSRTRRGWERRVRETGGTLLFVRTPITRCPSTQGLLRLPPPTPVFTTLRPDCSCPCGEDEVLRVEGGTETRVFFLHKELLIPYFTFPAPSEDHGD